MLRLPLHDPDCCASVRSSRQTLDCRAIFPASMLSEYEHTALMKIALVIASLGPGGAERVMSVLANYWAERGDDVTIITLQSREADVYVLDRRVKRAALGLVSDSAGMFRAVASNWQRIRALRAAIRSTGAGVVLSFEDRSNALVVIATLGLPVHCVISERTDPTL